MPISESDDRDTVLQKLRDELGDGSVDINSAADWARYLNGKTLRALYASGRLEGFIQKCQLGGVVEKEIVTAALITLLAPTTSPWKSVSELSSSSPSSTRLSREDRMVSPNKRSRDEPRRRESVGASLQRTNTALNFQRFKAHVFPFTAGAPLDSDVGLGGKIPKGRRGAGMANVLHETIEVALTSANVNCVVGSVQTSSSGASQSLVSMAEASDKNSIIVLDPHGDFVKDVAAFVLSLLACAFDSTPFWTLQLKLEATANSRQCTVTDIHLKPDAPSCQRSSLYGSVANFVCTQLESAKKRIGAALREYSGIRDYLDQQDAREVSTGSVLFVQGAEPAEAAKDAVLVETLVGHLKNQGILVLAKAFTDLGALESAVAADVDVVVFLPSSFDTVFAEKTAFEEMFLDLDGDGKKFERAITLPHAEVLEAAVFEQIEMPPDLFEYRLREGDCNFGNGELRLRMSGQTVVTADLVPAAALDDAGKDPLDPAVLSILQMKNTATTITLPTKKFIQDRTDWILHQGPAAATAFARDKWTSIRNGSGDISKLTHSDIASLAKCGTTSVETMLKEGADLPKPRKTCTRQSPSVLRSVVQVATVIETLPRTPFAFSSKHVLQQLSFVKKAMNKKRKMDDTDAKSKSSSSTGSSKTPRWTWNGDAINYLTSIAKRNPGAQLWGEHFQSHKIHLLQRSYNLYNFDYTELKEHFAKKGIDIRDLERSLEKAVNYWWTGTDKGKGVPLRLENCKAAIGKIRDKTWCMTKKCTKCATATATTEDTATEN